MPKTIYDIETIKGCFILCALPEVGSKFETFILSRTHNDYDKLIKHLEQPDHVQIGFNNVKFDAQVCAHLLENKDEYSQLSSLDVANRLYDYAQYVIALTNQGEFPPTPHWKLPIKQIDLFALNHFDNPSKRTSLKALQIHMRLENVQDMPLDFRTEPYPEQVPLIVDYCKNDVLSTRAFYRKNIEAIQLRRDLEKTYRGSFINLSDSSIGEKIFKILLQKKMNIPMNMLSQMRTYRESVAIEPILLKTIKFNNPIFQELHEGFKQLIVVDTKKAFSYTVKVQNLEIVYGVGGVHASVPPSIHEADENTIIHDIDVTSFYPNLAIVNNFRPLHLGSDFNKIYKQIFEQRQKIPKTNPLNKAYKLMLNSVYGKSNSHHSYLYDPEFTMKITCNGQLLITMLIESLMDDVTLLQVNTDGITVKYDKSKTELVAAKTAEWEKMTKLQLESAYYKKMVIENVNNYIAVTTSSKVKAKGRFSAEPEYHQDPSGLVVAKALQNYYVYGKDVVESVYENNDPFDFMIRARFRGDDKGVIITPTETIETSKNTRYYVSNTGFYFTKNGTVNLKDGTKKKRNSVISAAAKVKEANIIRPEDHQRILKDIDRTWYIKQTYDIINNIDPRVSMYGTQQTMF